MLVFDALYWIAASIVLLYWYSARNRVLKGTEQVKKVLQVQSFREMEVQIRKSESQHIDDVAKHGETHLPLNTVVVKSAPEEYKATVTEGEANGNNKINADAFKVASAAPVSSLSPKKSAYFEFDPDIHVRVRPGMSENMEMVNALRQLLIQDEPVLAAHDDYVMTDIGLWRYLVARGLDLQAARKQAVASLKWRDFRKPHLLKAEDVRVELETGKMTVRGHDKHGRPVVVLDSSRENTWDAKGNMLGLVYTLQRAFRKMENSVDKYVLVIRLQETSMFNFSKLPGPTQVKETIKILMTVFAERLGHIVIYRAPAIFTVFVNLFRSLMDAHVLSKSVWVYGDISAGSSNDESLKNLIGDNWRVLFAEGQPSYDIKWTPGFDRDVEWKKICDEEQEEIRKGNHAAFRSSTSTSVTIS